MLSEALFGLTVAVVIGLYYSWPLALVILGIIPLILLTQYLHQLSLTGHASNDHESLVLATEVCNPLCVGVHVWVLVCMCGCWCACVGVGVHVCHKTLPFVCISASCGVSGQHEDSGFSPC